MFAQRSKAWLRSCRSMSSVSTAISTGKRCAAESPPTSAGLLRSASTARRPYFLMDGACSCDRTSKGVSAPNSSKSFAPKDASADLVRVVDWPMAWDPRPYDSRRRAISMLCLRVLATALLGLLSPSVTAAENGGSGIEALFLLGPVQGGPARQGVPNSVPFAGAPITIAKDGHTIATVTTDAEGRLRLPLAPGRYTLAVKGKAGFGRCGPFDVDVVAGEFQTRQWQCDSGLR